MPDEAPPAKATKAAKSAPKADEKSADAPSAAPAAVATATTTPPAKSATAAKPAATKPAPKKAGPATPAPATSSKPPRPEPGSEFPPTATVIDASGLVLGRAASLIAQRLLHGEVIVVVNAEKSVVTGNRRMVVREYTAARAQGSVRSGPHFPRYPDRIFRRTVRGMLPHLKTRGKIAYSHLHVFIGTPPGLTGRTHVPLPGAQARPALRPPTTLADITRLLGARV